MTNQERKNRILTKLRNILFLLLGITVIFISIRDIINAGGKMSALASNLLWIILAIVVVAQSILSIIQSFSPLSTKAKSFLLIDWLIIVLGILIANFAYLLQNNLWLIIGGAIFIAGCIPIKDKNKTKIKKSTF